MLSLVIVPAFFLIMDDLSRLLAWIFGRFIGKKDEESPLPDAAELAAGLEAKAAEIAALEARIGTLEQSDRARRGPKTLHVAEYPPRSDGPAPGPCGRAYPFLRKKSLARADSVLTRPIGGRLSQDRQRPPQHRGPWMRAWRDDGERHRGRVWLALAGMLALSGCVAPGPTGPEAGLARSSMTQPAGSAPAAQAMPDATLAGCLRAIEVDRDEAAYKAFAHPACARRAPPSAEAQALADQTLRALADLSLTEDGQTFRPRELAPGVMLDAAGFAPAATALPTATA